MHILRNWFPVDNHCLLKDVTYAIPINTFRLRQNGRHFADDIFKRIFLNENIWISISIPLKFVPKGPINNIPALVQIMAWRRPGDKPLSEPIMVNLLMHVCVTRPQWVDTFRHDQNSCHFAFSGINMIVLWFKFHLNLFISVRLTVLQDWFR